MVQFGEFSDSFFDLFSDIIWAC